MSRNRRLTLPRLSKTVAVRLRPVRRCASHRRQLGAALDEKRLRGHDMKATAKHYEGLEGHAYYAWQRRVGLMGGHLEARKFSSSIESHDTVLDFGCGSGAMLRSLTCARRVGIDINPAARSEAAANGVEVYASLAEVPSSSIDVVVSNHALEHALSPYEVLCELLRVLIPGGRLVICVPFDDWRTQRVYDPRDSNHHLYTWSPLLIANLLCEAGFEVESGAILTHACPGRQGGNGSMLISQCVRSIAPAASGPASVVGAK